VSFLKRNHLLLLFFFLNISYPKVWKMWKFRALRFYKKYQKLFSTLTILNISFDTSFKNIIIIIIIIIIKKNVFQTLDWKKRL